MRGFHAIVCFLLGLALCATVYGQSRAAGPGPDFLIIVHPGNEATGAERQFLEEAFLKKVTQWPNGSVIRPVDLVPSSPVRRRFSEQVLNRSVEAVKGYWQQRIFSGRDIPPPELDTDDEVVAFVLKHEGGVGYVSAAATLNGAKVLVVR
jgi:hypothetical protein